MPKCENCYHYEICEFNLEHQGIDLASIVIASKDESSADGCLYFKDKSLIVEMPCRVGDPLYVIIDESKKFGGAYIKQEKIIETTGGRIWTSDCYYDSDDIGRIIFFNRDEAEKALEKHMSVYESTIKSLNQAIEYAEGKTDNVRVQSLSVMPKKYIVRAAAEIEATIETSTPECAKEFLESILKNDGISADISNISLQEVSEIPLSFKKQLYDKFTHRKG